ncbi:MAG TPA: glycosyl hydrolase family 28-related protein, partial [Polyangia bacterium]|nr:glycosyl hydrolase family 28-related protein [Polyangia bacterium]
PTGATIMLQKDSMDSAASYTIDLVDFEDVGAPLTQPAGSLSLTDYGAIANDGNDDGPALQNAINDAQTKGKTLWIPSGTFDILFNNISDVTKRNIQTNGISIQGAGMWYTTLNGFGAQIKLGGNTCSFSDFLLSGDITFRDDTKGYQGFDGPYGKGSKVTNVWIEHTNVGLWVGHGAKPTPVTAPLTDGLVVHGIRVRDTYADGINLANATSNSTVEQSVFRNTGDDSMASWSYSGDGSVACSNDMFHFNTMQVSWRAACMSIYGGNNISMEDNVCSDTTNYPGILVSTTFSPLPLTGTTSVQRNTLARDGGFHFNQQYGAIKFFADTQPLGGTITVKNIDITDPTYAGIHFGGSQQQSGITLDTVTVTNYTTQGIWVASESHGTATFNSVSVAGTPNVGLQNDAPNAFTVTKGSGDSGF